MNAIAKTKANAKVAIELETGLFLGKIVLAVFMIAGLATCAAGLFATNIVVSSLGALLTIAGAILFAWMVVHYEICE